MKIRFGQYVRGLAVLALMSSIGAAPAAATDTDNIPIKVHQRAKVQFPIRALNLGILRGEASLMMDVDHTGRVVDVLAFAYTRREFADSALDAVKHWRFTPGRSGGEPVGSMITLTVMFEVTGVLAYVKPIAASEEENATGDQFAYQPIATAALDHVPAALQRDGPIYPRQWIDEGRTGAVTVEFFIDETGAVRLPRVVGKADEFLGAASVAAVRTWRFEPPRHKGRPVLTRASQVFTFHPEPNARKT
ncbi:MAG: TonB family protein [Opitutaceae bacterium]|nr:TonB family protein [Opitutaceae bacterium]